MDARLQKLTDWGCNVDDGLRLAMGKEDLFFECLTDVTEDENYALMLEAIKEKNIKKAFDASHTLKGVYANLGLTPMYEKSVEIVEPLRAGRCEDRLLDKVHELIQLNTRLASILQTSE